VKIPRDWNGAELARGLRQFGYEIQRQTGSHLQLTTQRGGEHHVTVPNHRPLKVGLLHGVLKSVAEHHHMTVEELVRQLEL
jgi:predicted RNA binding protein YcfA (HicA-like mRNA interferase family)